MKSCILAAGAGCLVVLVSGLSMATDVGGPVDVDTTWSVAGSPYTVVETVTVLPDVELTIQPGVTVHFQGSTGLTVNGVLTAVGTVGNPVVLMGGAAGGNTVSDESRILIDDATGSSRVEHAVVSHFNNAFEIFADCSIERSIIQQNQSVGVLVVANYDPTEPRIANNLIMHNDSGISLANSSTARRYAGTYEYNTIVRNRTVGFKTHDYYGHCDSVTVSHSIIAFNGYGLLCESQDIISENNLLWHNAVTVHPEGMPSVGEMIDNPWFVDPVMWDFHVMDYSPAATGGVDGEEIGAYGNGGGMPANTRQYSTSPTISGTLVADERWSGVVEVTGTVTVPIRYALVIEPGTTVRFAGDSGLEVWGVLFAVGTSNQMIVLEGGGVDGSVGDTSRLFLNGTPGETTVKYSNLGFFFDGIFAEESCSAACFINHNVIHDNQRNGLHLESTRAGAHPVVVNNIVKGNSVGVFLKQTHSSKDIYGTYEYNTIVDNINEGFYLYDQYGSYTVKLRNSIVTGNGLGIVTWGGGVSDIVFASEYNDSWANAFGNYFSYWSVVGPGTGDISIDPMFVDDVAGDYHLQPGSPALTASSEGGEIGAYGLFPTPQSPLVFSDGFESGGLSGWS